ncbi:YajG family lipoprotein [Marinomonas aquiplantarum]|uniref:Putative lipoprotein n=1 Tax=Marinomonas aquiplantarum TaxID=491951 RepID=A0A366CTM6_9GAMM|nr:YajG family lipoprotein [Marinomonas aquiplantarum]RBO79636.1 putative lipoprotein [Marinomonas aquiplantarum]
MRNKSIILALSISTLLLAGCSTTHYISVEPKAAVENTNLTNERVIKVSTSTKITNSIGSIKTGLNERADIYTTNDVKESVRESVVTGLRQLGFTPDQGVLPAADLQIHITKMSYTTKVDALKTVATMDFELNVVLAAKGQTYKANFGSQKVREYGTMPYQSSIQEDMNELASQTVTRLLADPNIISLLK